MSPLWLLTVRFLASGGILMCFLWNRVKKLRRKHVVLGILLGGVLAATFIAHVVGLLYTTPGKQSFIAGSNVVMVPFLYALFYKRLPSLLATLGAFVTTVGLLVMAFTPGMSFNLGDGLSLLLAVGIAFHVLLVGNLSRRMDPVALTVVQLFASGVFLLTLSLVLEPIPHFGDVSPKVWWGIGYIVAFVTVIPFFIQTVAQRYSPETHAAIILSMESPFGYIIAIALGEEMLNLQIVLGGALILAGVFLAELEIFLERRK
jgi:drug/metabolite transporter (DMT)-like permease